MHKHDQGFKSNANEAYSLIRQICQSLNLEDDRIFDKALYPEKIIRISETHWTPIRVALKAARWLANSDSTSILDIGSGVGKFCIIAGLDTRATYTGIEQRKTLYSISQNIVNLLGLDNVKFLNTNITQIDFTKYNAFYFYNPFEENVYVGNRIDDDVALTWNKFISYTCHVKQRLSEMPESTRLVTYCSNRDVIPENYIRVKEDFNGKLVLWIKKAYK